MAWSPPSSRTIEYDDVLSTCLANVRRGLIDSIFTSNAFLSALYGAYGKKKKKGKGIRLVDGGERIQCPLMYGKNSTARSYSGYDVLDVTPQEGITTAFFEWRQLAVAITISRIEQRKNSSPHRIRDLLEGKTEQAGMSLFEEVNLELLGKTVSSSVFVAGNGMSDGTDLDPLPMLIPKNPSSSVTVGNINQSSYAWWRPWAVDGGNAHASKYSGANRGFAVTTWATLFAAMRWLYNSCSIGAGGAPDLILNDQLTYESYEAGVDERSRIVNNSNGPVSVGFESVRFKGADMIWDSYVPDLYTGVRYDSASWAAGTQFFLNTDMIELVLDTETDFITTPFTKPENQDAKVAHILCMMNLTSPNRRKLGQMCNLTVPITS